jgi:hypothetical protein
MFNHVITEKVEVGATQITKTSLHTGAAKQSIEETVPDSSTDLEIAFALDVSQLKSIYIVSDQDITLETNSGSAADDTIALVAGVPYIWHSDSYHTCLLGTDITELYATNASGTDATLQIEALYDPTL